MDEPGTWRTSSYSGSQSNCVELFRTLDALRDSKNADGPVLRLDLTTFVRKVKAGEFGG
jgi:hypothetical protein